MSTIERLPTGPGDNSTGTPVNSDSGWQCVDEANGSPNDSDYIQYGASGEDDFTYSAFNVPTGATINSVKVYFRVNGTAGGATAKIDLNGTWYSASAQNLPSSKTTYSKSWTTDPATGQAWTVAHVNSTGYLAQFGVAMSPGDEQNGALAQCSIVVDYTAAASAPTVTTQAVDTIGSTSASGHGTVTADGGASVTERGVCWKTSSGPTTSDSKATSGTGTGAYSPSMTGLSPGTLYYVRAYAKNSVGTSYGSEVTFTTLAAPTVTTQAVDTIGSTTATGHGNVTADGGATITERGVCWNTSTGPTTSNSKATSSGTTGAYSPSMTGLSPGTLYYARAYAINSVGTSYGSEVTFTTLAAPTVTTQAVDTIGSTTATGHGNVTADGGATITERGVCWNTSTGPTTSNSKATSSGTTGAYSPSMTGLSPGTLYYVRAYAINSVGTSYGSEVTFTTLAAPTVTTQAVDTIGSTSASGHGNVTADGGASVTERGVCWKTSTGPTTSDSKATSSGTTGAYSPSMTGLSPGTLYYVRAYAINSVGTSYGSEVTFSTNAAASNPIAVGGGGGASSGAMPGPAAYGSA